MTSHCPHCGGALDTPTDFRDYERRVAGWLRGEVAPKGNAGFDVWKCEPFPNLTFQVKHANAVPYKDRPSYSPQWGWTEHTHFHDKPDFYVLCGIKKDVEHWFILSNRAYLEASYPKGKGRQLFARGERLVAKGYSRRKVMVEGFIWRYHCPQPERMIDFILKRQETEQLALL